MKELYPKLRVQEVHWFWFGQFKQLESKHDGQIESGFWEIKVKNELSKAITSS